MDAATAWAAVAGVAAVVAAGAAVISIRYARQAVMAAEGQLEVDRMALAFEQRKHADERAQQVPDIRVEKGTRNVPGEYWIVNHGPVDAQRFHADVVGGLGRFFEPASFHTLGRNGDRIWVKVLLSNHQPSAELNLAWWSEVGGDQDRRATLTT